MKITGIKINIFSSQHRNAKRNWLILRLQTDEGLEGIGEASMLSHDPIVADLLERWTEAYLVGKDPMAHELHWMRMHQEYHAEFYEPHYFEVFDGLPRQENGYVDLLEGPGLGLTFNEDIADAHPYMPLGVGERGI